MARSPSLPTQLLLVLAVSLSGMAAGCRSDGNPGSQTTSANAPAPANAPHAVVPDTARNLEVVAREMAFEPAEITAEAGQSLRITLRNQGQKAHNLEIELPEGKKELERNVMPGDWGILEFDAPKEPGRYVLYCPVGDHKKHGMAGEMIVTPPHPAPEDASGL